MARLIIGQAACQPMFVKRRKRMASKTATFRQHHSDVQSLVARLEKLLDAEGIAANPEPAATVAREIFGKFTVHLAIEDATLYPKMLSHADPQVKSTAGRFMHEMGDLKAEFDAYGRRWPGPQAIGRNPQGFVTETRDVLRALQWRIRREDVELYDLYDKAG